MGNAMSVRQRTFLLSLLVTASCASLLTFAQSNERLPRVPLGAVAAQLTGRLVGGGGLNGDYEIICYLTFIEGLGSDLYSGTPASEKNARFTLRTDKFRFQTIPNGTLIHFGRLAVPDTGSPAVRLYYSPAPNHDFAQPDSFSDGQLIATYRTRGIQGGLTPSISFRGEGSLTLESATEFTVGGRTISLRSLGDAATVTLAGVPPSSAEFAIATALSVPLSGTIHPTRRFRR